MVTFSLPGDDVVEAKNGTPRSKPPLPFAKRAFAAASPFGSSSAKRSGTPYASSSRKLLTTREEIPSSSLNNSSICPTRNIFSASTVTKSPPTSTFSPSIPNSTMKKVFAPGATPEPSRVYRESIAHATPRGMAAKTSTKQLFPMRIASPPPELTGEVLTQKVPKEWNAKGSIYADQFLAHLCPPELDEEQRRQFFCILDLRRLKYAANEIFSKKDWKLNVINFAKEFEKSRSIILLRYGLYEFQNVKPSQDVLKRWRREHGLPELEKEEDVESTPSRSTSRKRKATEDDSITPATKGKRQAIGQPAENSATLESTSIPMGKNKRKASVSEEQPAKMLKSTPSSAKSLLEKIANKSASSKSSSKFTEDAAAVPKPNLFNTNKPANSSNLARAVLTNVNTLGAQTASASGNNIFGYLSDASSAKNSGIDADAESEPDSDQDESQDAGHSDEPSVAASGIDDAGSHAESSLLGKRPALPSSGRDAGLSSAPGTRESTPGRSIFDRVTKGSDGQPVRVEERVEGTEADPEPELEPDSQVEFHAEPVKEKPAVTNQTWNPTTTPIKFAPTTTSAPSGSLFGNGLGSSASSNFASKTTAFTKTLGAVEQDGTAEKEASKETANGDQASKDGGESDKENESQPAKKAIFDTKPSGQPTFGSNSFGGKPAAAASELPKPAAALFGKPDTTTTPRFDTRPAETSATPSLFSQSSKPAENAPSSTLFGAKPAKTDTSSATETTAATSLFGGATPKSVSEPANTNNLFGVKTPSTASSLFSSGASTTAQQTFFGASSLAATGSTAVKRDAPKPIFNFGSTTAAPPVPTIGDSRPLFGAPKSPPAAAASNNLFGSPMKQDNPSPAKKRGFDAESNGGSAPTFNFGAGGQPAASEATVFGAAPISSSSGNGSRTYGSASSSIGSGSGGFNFSFGGGPSVSTTAGTTTFNNPFASGAALGNATTSAAPSGGGIFTFAPGSSALSGASSSFQFGSGSDSASAPPTGNSGGSLFGAANHGNNGGTSIFGGASESGSAPSFNFSAGGAASQGTGSVFGSNQAAPAFNLQPPAGGSTTTGTNSPLNFGSSLATTPAGGTPEPSAQTDMTKDGDANEEGERHEQINLVDAVDEEEEVLHEVRAKVLKFILTAEKMDDGDNKPKSKSPWSTQGVGQLRLLRHKETKLLRLLLRAEPRGHVALNRAVLPNMSYKADEKYVKLTTSNEKGNGLETWMVQVKTKDLAKDLAEVIEKNKESNET